MDIYQSVTLHNTLSIITSPPPIFPISKTAPPEKYFYKIYPPPENKFFKISGFLPIFHYVCPPLSTSLQNIWFYIVPPFEHFLQNM